MSLAEEIAKDLDDAVSRTTPMLEAAVTGPHIATPEDIQSMEVQRAQRQAILRLAHEVDQLRAALAGGNSDS